MMFTDLVLQDLYELEELAQRSVKRGDEAEAKVYQRYIDAVRQELLSDKLNEVYASARVVREFIRQEQGDEESVPNVRKLVGFIENAEHPSLEFVGYKMERKRKRSSGRADRTPQRAYRVRTRLKIRQ